MRVGHVLGACLLVGALASCNGTALEGDGGTVLIGTDDGDNMAGVGLGGEVALVGDCLGLDEALIIWPPWTEVTAAEPLTISVPGLGAVKVGDRIEGGGQEYDISHPPDGLKIPAGCPSDLLFSFFPDR